MKFASRIPVTIAFVTVTIVVFVCSRINDGSILRAQEMWRSLTPTAFGTPAFWLLLLPSAIFHSGPWHLVTNMFAFMPLAAVFETREGSLHACVFVILNAAACSAAQLLFAGHGDIGSSGIVFGVVGWVLIAGRLSWKHQLLLTMFVTLLLLWFLYCFIANHMFGSGYGTASHAAGLLLGISWGSVTTRTRERQPSRAAG